MIQVVLVIQLIVTIAMIGLILIQRSEGGGLGIGGGGGGLGGMASPQSTANALTKATAFCALIFFVANMALAVMTEGRSGAGSISDHLNKIQAAQTTPADAAPAEEKAPSVPVAE